jgi:hypothetical protein
MKHTTIYVLYIFLIYVDCQNVLSQTISKTDSNSYSVLAGELAKEKRIVIGILYDSVFNGRETPKSLTPQQLQKLWSINPDVRVVLLNVNQIRSYSILFKGKMDILVYPYGGIYPMDAFGLYSAQTYSHFIKKGGAILTTGGVPFSKQASTKGEIWGKSDSISVDFDAYERWISKFGIKYYFSKNTPAKTLVNSDFLSDIPSSINVRGCRTGIIANNSSSEPVPKPPHGNVFPERYPTKQVIPLLYGTDKYNKVLAINAVLVQDYQNGSRQIFFTHEAEPHPLSPLFPYYQSMMDNILRLLVNKVMVKSVESKYACYKQGETVNIKSEIASFEIDDKNIEIILQVFDGGKEVFRQSDLIKILAKSTLQKVWNWSPKRFENDEYTLKLTVRKDKKVISMAENGFVVWNNDIAMKGPSVEIRNEYFKIGSKETFISGTNYYESTRGEVMWFRPDVKRIIDDLKEMRSNGINYIRPHYHHLKWFHDYLTYQYDSLFSFYKELENIEDPFPDERAWRIFDMFIYLCQKYNIVYGGDLFTLVPAEMGDPRGWFGTTETIYDPDKRKIQKEFLRLISMRYKDINGISWDLFNEPSFIPEKDVASWAQDLRTVIKGIDAKMLTTVGGANQLGSATDYDSPHGNPEVNYFNDRNKPYLIQEMYVDNKENYNCEIIQSEDIRKYYMITIRNGFAGICPWSWTRQMRLRQDSYEHHYTFQMEKWDDRLGMHVHDDGTMKLAGQVFKDMSMLIRTISFVDFDIKNKRVLTSKGEVVVTLNDENNQKGYSLYHVSGDKCFGAIAYGTASWNNNTLISASNDAYVYLYSQDGNDVLNSKQLYAKSDKPGKLIINRKDKPKNVLLVDNSPLGKKVLENLSYEFTSNSLVIPILPSMDEYWIEINYK